jgi:uncharacterized protein YuzE
VLYNRGADEAVVVSIMFRRRWWIMRISHDKVSGALYVELREGEYDHTEDFSEGADVYLDVNAEGTVLGLEALSFEDLAQASDEHGGQLELPERLGASDESEADANLGRRSRRAGAP